MCASWQNLLLMAGEAVSEVGFVHVSLDGLQRLLQHWEGTAQRFPPPGCRAHITD